MARSSKTSVVDSFGTELVDEVDRLVRASRFVPRSRLSRFKLSPAALERLNAALVDRGLEVTPKGLRVALSDQVSVLVRDGARIAVAQVSKQVKGASASELKAALSRMVANREACVVVRGKVEVLVGPAERVLSGDELDRLATLVKKLRAKGWGKTLLREDLLEIASGASGDDLHPPSAATPDAWPLIATEMARLQDPTLRLVWIPDLIRRLADRLSTAKAIEALLAASRLGRIDLRADSSPDLLSPEDRALCVPGPRDTLLSYANLRAAGAGAAP